MHMPECVYRQHDKNTDRSIKMEVYRESFEINFCRSRLWHSFQIREDGTTFGEVYSQLNLDLTDLLKLVRVSTLDWKCTHKIAKS